MTKKLTKKQSDALDRVVRTASKGHIKNADQMVKMASSGVKVQKELALETFENITDKIIQQRIMTSTLTEDIYRKWRQFQENDLLGNGKEYVKTYAQGMAYPTDAGTDKYTPDERYDRTPITQTLANPVKKQFKLTMTGEQLLSKVVSKEKMVEIISSVVNTFEQDIDLYMTHVLYTLLANTTFSKVINDTDSTSAYYCARKIAQTLKAGSSYRKDFTIDTTTYPKVFDCLKPSNTILFFAQKTMVNFDVGISPVLFNPEKTGFNNLGVGQVVEMPATKYDNTYVENTQEEPAWADEPYIPENTVIALSKNSIAILPQLKKMATQRFINNLTDLYVYDFWYIAQIVKFTLGFKYTCDNLNKTPEESDVEEEE